MTLCRRVVASIGLGAVETSGSSAAQASDANGPHASKIPTPSTLRHIIISLFPSVSKYQAVGGSFASRVFAADHRWRPGLRTAVQRTFGFLGAMLAQPAAERNIAVCWVVGTV